MRKVAMPARKLSLSKSTSQGFKIIADVPVDQGVRIAKAQFLSPVERKVNYDRETGVGRYDPVNFSTFKEF